MGVRRPRRRFVPSDSGRSYGELEVYGKLPYIHAMSKGTSHKQARFEARISPDLHRLLKRAADLQGRTLTDFVMAAASDAARKTIAEIELIQLSQPASEALAERLLNPPAANEAMRRAFVRKQRLIGSTP
jgi:uncharacterized protein (DUF1778 family)